MSRSSFVAPPMVAAVVMLLAGCAPARLVRTAVPPDAPRLPVAGRQGWQLGQEFRFGGFQVVSLTRSWVKAPEFRLRAGAPFEVEVGKAEQTMHFTLRDEGGSAWPTECKSFHRRAGANVAGADIDPLDQLTLTCTITAESSGGGRWTLRLSEQRSEAAVGTLAPADGAAGEPFAVRAVQRLDGALPTPYRTYGYSVAQAGRPVAAVERVDRGAVWLSPAVTGAPRGALAATLSALLAVEDLREAVARSTGG
jgi:hypothetical protein